jgi:hypothetical protein
MKRLAFTRIHLLDKLNDELLAAIPALAPKANADSELEAVFTISGDGDELVLEVPDDVDEKAIAAVVDAHDPTPPAPPPDPALAIAAASTVEELKQAVLEYVDPELAEQLKGG